MTDIAPELLEQIQTAFTNHQNQDKIIRELYWKIQDGKADYRDVSRYAERLGELLADAIKLRVSASNLPDGRLYYNIAERVIGPLLREDYKLIANAAAVAQEALNAAAGLGLKAVRPKINLDRVQGLVDKLSEAESFDNVAWALDEPVVNFSMSIVDDAIRENVEFHARAGLSPTVTRIATGGCCRYCSRLAGRYDYPVDREVYRRHRFCRCVVLYDPGDGRKQDVHSKISYDSEREARVARARELEKEYERQNDIVHKLARSPEMLNLYSPEELVQAIRKAGYEISPLSHGSHKGVPFEQGGGYKVNFEDGGIIMYHPEGRSHHNGEYYKISTGKGGTKRYGRDGTEKD